MSNRTPAARRRWHVTLIVATFTLAVAGAAFTGWRFARESPPHQGPIVLISIDGLRADRLQAYGARTSAAPAIDTLAADSVVFDRAYTHSPQTLPSHAALLSGLLPFENGVRDDGGFTLRDDIRTLAEQLRGRGFNTGAAVSTFLLRRATGLAQGFAFFDAEIPDRPFSEGALPERDGLATFAAADAWLKLQKGQRYFLFLEVDASSADAVVGRLVDALKGARRYADATIVVTSDHGDAGSSTTLDDTSLRVPLIVKQPGAAGSGRHVLQPAQHIDILPTLLDVVRAPIPAGLRGRSLRAILDKTSGFVPDRPIYAELLAPTFRFDGHPLFALSSGPYRIVRGVEDQVQRLVADAPAPDEARRETLRTTLDGLLKGRMVDSPAVSAEADEDRLAAFGYLGALTTAPAGPDAPVIEAATQQSLATAHRNVAALVARRQYAAAVDRLRAIATANPQLPTVQYQLGLLLDRAGRPDDAAKVLLAAAALRPDDPRLPIALAGTLLRAHRVEDAAMQSAHATELAETTTDKSLQAAAHAIAVRVALARHDPEAATAEALAAQKADPGLPLPQYVRGQLLYEDEKYEEALTAFQQARAALAPGDRALADLNLSLGNAFARLDKYADAETAFQEELRLFPHSIAPYASLATLYHASNRDQDATRTIDALVEALPTTEGYTAAVRLLTLVGEKARANALRVDARRRFRGDPALALLGRTR